MSNQALIDIRAKIHRANHHFDDFKAEFGLGPRSTKRNVYPSGIHYEPNWTHIEVQTARFPQVQREVGLVFGDAIHQMRAGLDHVVSHLVLRKTGNRTATRKAQFPIFSSPEDFEKHKSVKFLVNTFGESSRELTAIRESQRYENHPTAPTEDGLWLLGGLDNIDKHRTLLLLCNRVSISGVAHSRDGLYESPFSFPKQSVQAATQVLTFDWPYAVPPATVEVNDVTPWIVVDGTDGLCDNRSVFQLFRLMESAVNATLRRFQLMIFFA